MDALAKDRINTKLSNKSLKLALLSYRSAPTVGGQGVYVDYLSRALVGLGHSVDVISGPPYPKLDSGVNLIKLASLDLYAQPHNGHRALRPWHLLSPTDTYEYFGHLSGKFVEPYTFGQRVFAYLKKHVSDYDAIIDNQCLSYGTLGVQDRLGLPLVTMIHHPITKDLALALEAAQNWKQRWLVRRWHSFLKMQTRVARQLNVVTCPSEHSKKDIAEAFDVPTDRIFPIPLGVDQDTFKPNAGVSKHRKRIITTASSDTPLKGLHILLESFHALLKEYPDLELVIIGTLRTGEAKRTLERLGLEGRVQFKSGLSREALAEEFCTASVAVTPSLYEGFGLPAAEAMSCRTAVVVTDGGALPEVAGQAGIIVPRGDAEALGQAISELIGDPERCDAIAEACYGRAKACFGWSSIAPRYDALIRQTMAAAC